MTAAVEKSTILSDRPVDDVWIRKFYPPPRFSIEEALQRHQAFAQPAMLNNMNGLLYLDMRLDLTTKKKVRKRPSMSFILQSSFIFKCHKAVLITIIYVIVEVTMTLLCS